jgi:hypothetical protein
MRPASGESASIIDAMWGDLAAVTILGGAAYATYRFVRYALGGIPFLCRCHWIAAVGSGCVAGAVDGLRSGLFVGGMSLLGAGFGEHLGRDWQRYSSPPFDADVANIETTLNLLATEEIELELWHLRDNFRRHPNAHCLLRRRRAA